MANETCQAMSDTVESAERDALRAEVERLRAGCTACRLERENDEQRARLAVVEPVFEAAKAWRVSDVAKQLAECLDYAHMVNEVLPVDSDADAMVARLLAERRARLPTGTRKLLPRSR